MNNIYIKRIAENTIMRLAKGFPVVVISGPRQSGKTSLVRHMFADKQYVSLEDIDERSYAISDPKGFLARFPDGAVFDEIQEAPQLLSYLQRIVDEDGRMELFILTGSQQLSLLAGVTQSLAGRAAYVTLLPLSIDELGEGHGLDLNKQIFTGFYPPLYTRDVKPGDWLNQYIATYLERDVREIVNIKDLSQFRTFLHMCAGRAGQMLNLSTLGNECGISHVTAKGWLSVLEACSIVFLVQPYYVNINKRLVKTPKLYFYDTGLVCRLLGLEAAQQVATHPLKGALFENFVAAELIKNRMHHARTDKIYYLREKNGYEVDFILDKHDASQAVEVKAGQTFSDDMVKGLKKWINVYGGSQENAFLLYGGADSYTRGGFNVLAWRDIGRL